MMQVVCLHRTVVVAQVMQVTSNDVVDVALLVSTPVQWDDATHTVPHSTCSLHPCSFGVVVVVLSS